MGVWHDIAAWLWRLLPGNPILVRVVRSGARRQRDHWVRLVYLLALVAVFVLGGGLALGTTERSLAELAKHSTRTFMAVSLVQLFLMCFVAPVFCAGAITQEKDANTYHILLTTPLSNAQIVLGSLFSRLFFVWTLLLSGLPIFSITMLYGGVTTAEIMESFGLAASTGLLTGSIAITISFLKVGTRRTMFAFFAGIAVYLMGVGLAGLSPWAQLAVAPPATTFLGTEQRMSWLAPLHPFLALLVATGQTPPPDVAALAAHPGLVRWALVNPQYAYITLTFGVSAVLILVSLTSVRRGARQGETGWLTGLCQRILPRRLYPGRRPVRRVWRNPIAWREAATRASAGGRSVMRLLFNVAGLTAGLALVASYHAGTFGSGAAAAAAARSWLVPLVWLELAVILLLVTNTAAATFTREKEAQTIELLLCTPLTSRYIVGGMLQGLVRLVGPLIAVPTVTLAVCAVLDMLRWERTPPLVAVEAVFLLPMQIVAFTALAAMIGLRFSLTSQKTVQAVMLSMVTVLGLAGLLSACGLAFRETMVSIAAVLLPFTPVWAVHALIDPWRAAEVAYMSSSYGSAPSADIVFHFRLVRSLFSLVAVGGYAAAAYSLYVSLVRNFDMTLRRQSA